MREMDDREDTEMQAVGLNVGFGWTKVVAGQRSAVFASVLAPGVQVRFENGLGDTSHRLHVQMAGHSWMVGEWAQLHSNSLVDIRARERDLGLVQVLMMAALFQVGVTEGNVGLVTGLPVQWFAQDREALTTGLLGPQRAVVNGQMFGVRVADVVVVPESYGSLYRELFSPDGVLVDGQGLREGRVGIVDVGTYTTNFILADRLRFAERGSESITVGMARVYELLQRRLAVYRDVSFREAEQVLRDGWLMVRGEKRNVATEIVAATDEVAGAIVGQAATLWGKGDDLAAVLVTGGGGLVLERDIRARFPHARVVEDPQLANAEGFYRYALRRFAVPVVQ